MTIYYQKISLSKIKGVVWLILLILHMTQASLQAETGVITKEISSGSWKDDQWKHELTFYIPKNAKHPEMCFLYISGHDDNQKDLAYIQKIAESAGISGAVIGSIPNQPLFEGKTEDRLLAYTLRKFIDTGDASWPILFPMVNAVKTAMDEIQKLPNKKNASVKNFVLSGSSKRAWTAYLSAAQDKRVIALAPMVFDMLNMKAQTDWAQKMYGAQSDKIKNYTELGLVAEIDKPRNKELRKLTDPFESREKLTQAKLILLGSNDPYWVVDAQIHYFNELPGHNLIYQVPNGDHHISLDRELLNTLINWLNIIANSKPLPEITWSVNLNGKAPENLKIKSSYNIKSARLWTADSSIRDFRKAVWQSEEFPANSQEVNLRLVAPHKGFRAWIGEITLENEGKPMRFSTTSLVSAN